MADEVVEQDHAEMLGGNGELGAVLDAPHALLDRAEPVGPPADRGADRAWPPGLARHRGGGVAAVAERVDDPRPREEAKDRLRLADVVGRHLHQPGLTPALRERPEQVEVELPAGGDGVVGVGGLEALQRLVELRLAEQVVEAARLPVDAHPVPPEAAHLLEVAAQGDPPLQQVWHPPLVAVEAGLDRNVREVAVAAEQVGQRVGAGASRPTDEDEVPPIGGGAGGDLGGGAHAGWRANARRNSAAQWKSSRSSRSSVFSYSRSS